ncbi:M28 family peptidase [Wenzhouxiangella limi]|uniref:Carboxypeptidase Q n=1 Tax=Wenzhouxiangella limi TaxID=2707351 RepID=A0A845VF32_9GAMM|nr:M28 family peptidase [Wenzhouxiangella limi]NDY95839.1 M28 family peptidase [Wenzhouxiangella limi]
MRFWILLCLSALLTVPAVADIFSADDLAVARELREQALAGDGGYEIVADLTTRIGPRLAGSEADPRAVAWAERLLTEMGFDRVWLEPATFPTWHRNLERAQITEPVAFDMVTLALGFSPATPAGGLEGEVVMFDDLAALEAAEPAEVKGRIVFIRNRMRAARDGSGYGPAVQARSIGARVAASKGGLALMIRSIGTSSNRFAHTGTQRFDADTRALPAVAISNPDADRLERLIAMGEPVRAEIEVDAEFIEAYTSHNVIAEITGSKYPEQIVALGAHLDSWDVGTGALDDGAGIAIVTEAGRLILDLEQRPDRSIQIIYFAAEEIGLWGGRAWAEANADNFHNIQVGAESDFGAGPIYEIAARVSDQAWPVIKAIQAELAPLGIELGDRRASGGPDFIPAAPYGMAAIDLRQDGLHYFDYHHTENDTLDKINPEELAQNAAAYAVLAWLSAQSPIDFGSGETLLDEEAARAAE